MRLGRAGEVIGKPMGNLVEQVHLGMAKKTTKKKPGAKKVTKKAATKGGGAAKKKATKRFVKAKHAPGLTKKSGASGMERPRGDLNQPGEVAIERLPEPKRAIARAADAMIRRAVGDCESVVKWGNAVYFTAIGGERMAFASLMETKAGINLALPGAVLDDPEGLLEGTGKTMRHVKLHSEQSVERKGVTDLVVQASKVGLRGM